MVIVFQDYCCSNLENENTFAIEMKKHFTEAGTENCSSNLCLGSFYENHLKMFAKASSFQSSSNEHILGTFQRFSSNL